MKTTLDENELAMLDLCRKRPTLPFSLSGRRILDRLQLHGLVRAGVDGWSATEAGVEMLVDAKEGKR